MEWWLIFVVIFGSLIVLLALGMPVAFCFLLINVVGVFLFMGGEAGLSQLIVSLYASVTSFILLPLPLFVLMGEVMFYSGIAPFMIDALDKWLGRLPGRLSLLAVAGGTVFATLTGASMASAAMLGTILVPEMENRGYKKPMTLGPILGSGCLAIMIPPSGLAVFLGAVAEISIGDVLIAIIIPGIMIALIYTAYIIIRCQLQPSIAPAYAVEPSPLKEKLISTARYIVPIGFIIFLVIGVIILGIATPTEAAATGALGTFILAGIYGRLKWNVVKKSIDGALRTSIMMLFIIVGASVFSQLLAFTGASRGLVQVVLDLPLAPIFILIGMQVILLFLGCFMDPISIMMITVPLFMPVVYALQFDPVWWAVLYLANIETASITPPFGLSLFVMKGVAPADTKMSDIYLASLPFVGLILIALAVIIAFPAIALWLPGITK